MNNILAMDLLISEATERPKGIRETGEPATRFLVRTQHYYIYV
jgi:hypothetical protein